MLCQFVYCVHNMSLTHIWLLRLSMNSYTVNLR